MLTVADSVISRNSSEGFVGGGGGILIGGFPSGQSGGIVTLTNSTISDNFVKDASGGAMAIQSDSTVTIDHSSIVDHRGRYSAGIVASYGTLIIHASTIARNLADECGSGLSVSSSVTATVRASTIVDNRSRCGSGNGVNGPARLENTIVARNLPLGGQGLTYVSESNCAAPFTSLGHNLIGKSECVDLQPTDVVGDPGLRDFIDPGRPGTGHYPLLAGSLAIDVGSDEACGRRDQQGLVRRIDGDGDAVRGCDIGAIEFYPVMNEWVQLDRVHATFVPPSAKETGVNPLATGGTYRIDAAFTNLGRQNLCHVAFEVITLQTTSGLPTVLTRDGNVIGREGIIVPAELVGQGENLRAENQGRYRFTIGVSEAVPLTFFVNVMGERTPGRCSPRQVTPDASDSPRE
jgi:hypothetical protein